MTAAPLTAGMALECHPDIVGVDLEATPDDGLIGPAEDPQEPLGIEPGDVGGPDPRGVRAELSRLDFENPLVIGGQAGARFRIDHPELASGVGPPDAAPLGGPELSVIGQVPSGHSSPNSVAA